MSNTNPKTPDRQREPILPNLIFNILLPIVLLRKGDDWLGWTAAQVLLLALMFPLGYGLRDLITKKKVNLFSVIGLVSILLTGVVSLLKLPPIWMAVKEASIPAIIGLLVLGSMRTRYPLVRTFVYNPQIIQVDRVDEALEMRGTRAGFDRSLSITNWVLGASFFLSAILNYVLARIMLKTHPAVDAVRYNQELASMYAWSYVVIALPSTLVMVVAFFVLLKGLRKHTGLPLEQLIHGAEEPKPSAGSANGKAEG